jgi:ABC-type multidrug transport system ATPase subunit
MSERILKALMQLFAIIARAEGGNLGRNVVETFLRQQLTSEQLHSYLKFYDEFFAEYHGSDQNADSEKKRKRTSLSSVKILKICNQINLDLAHKQKIIVLIRLLEFINTSEEVTSQDLEFVETVADSLNIDKNEFKRCLSFIIPRSAEDLSLLHSHAIDISPEHKHERYHIYSPELDGKIGVLNVSDGEYYLVRYAGNSDLNLNGQVMLSERVYFLNQGASIRSTKVKPIYYSDIVARFLNSEDKPKVVFRAESLEYKFTENQYGLHTFTFQEESGKMVGIMGASGAGKSTLLNILNGNLAPTSGSITINGFDLYKEKSKTDGLIGYISQDDLLMEDLTVFQNLYFNAKLCFAHYSKFQLTRLVLKTLRNLGLYEIRHLKVGNALNKKISGGQRKRVNIALELLREPSILFVDEPTSGLSSRDSENIMDLLKELSLKGKLVFVVIHQPSSDIFKMFDRLLILDTGGFPVYSGNPVDGVAYFKEQIGYANNEVECWNCGNVNPELIFTILESKVLDEYGAQTEHRRTKPKEWNQLYHRNIPIPEKQKGDKHLVLPEITFRIPDKFNQFIVFVRRDVLSKLTNTQYLLINLLETPLLALILAFLVRYYNQESVGYIYRENENLPAYLFMCVVVSLFIGLTVSAEEIIRDRKILKREEFLNLSRFSYLSSKVGIMFFLSAIQTILFLLIGNTILGVKGMTMDYFLVLFSVSCFANMLGLNISASFNSAVTIYILIPFLIIPQLLLSGVIVSFDKLNPSFASQSEVPLAGEVMASKWAYEALAVNQFKSNQYGAMYYESDKQISIANFRKNFWVPEVRKKVDFCENHFQSKDSSESVQKTVALLAHELRGEVEFGAGFTLKCLPQLEANQFSTQISSEIRSYLEGLEKYYLKQSNKFINEKDKITSDYIREHGDSAYNALKDKYNNDNLTDLVRNKNNFDLYQILERDGQFLQRTDPIYLDPNHSNFMRAHFFAPRKKLLGVYLDTFWANILVIWLMSISLMVTLYFDLMKKGLDKLESLSGKLPFLKKE